LKLIIPETSRKYLTDIKERVGTKLLNQIECYICEPFWFIQGVVIIGKLPLVQRNNALTPLGCFYYKTKFSDDDVMSDEGIFIDLKDRSGDDFTEAVRAYYFLLNTSEYEQNQYKVKKIFSIKPTGCDDYGPHESIKPIEWSDI